MRPKPFPDKERSFTFRPDIICTSIVDVNFAYLRKLGITTCLIDLDGTVVGRGRFEVDPRIGKALSNSKLHVHIATNRPKSRSLQTLKEDLYAASVIHPRGIFGKPSKRYYLNALKQLQLQPGEVVMIGDRFIQDMLGANRAGIYSLLVRKLGESVGRGDRYISLIEKIYTDRLSGRYKKLR
jgi:HAD superfamily phosphatase (TIGR01668 family)